VRTLGVCDPVKGTRTGALTGAAVLGATAASSSTAEGLGVRAVGCLVKLFTKGTSRTLPLNEE